MGLIYIYILVFLIQTVAEKLKEMKKVLQPPPLSPTATDAYLSVHEWGMLTGNKKKEEEKNIYCNFLYIYI